ncbi:MAG: enoyl-CoA hydratase/isomerase family protein [Proteobacteria bacterium]|nr:enoyl-CoA hydratase/isomerase family protein [Pseudomonadota bacterium]
MSEFETLKYETRDHVGLLTLNRPQSLNAINETMLGELETFWRARRHDAETRVVILSGAGDKGFCAGLDLKEAFTQMAALDLAGFYNAQSRGARLMLSMRQAPQPIIAAIHGAAAGVGLSFALASDLRLITPDARFAASFVNIGLGGADVGSSYFLPRLIGAGRAYEFLLTGDFMDAETAFNLGLVSRVVPRDRLLDEAMELAQKMCRKNPLGLRLTKEAINCNLDAAGLEQALNVEDRNQTLCLATIRYEGQNPDTR